MIWARLVFCMLVTTIAYHVAEPAWRHVSASIGTLFSQTDSTATTGATGASPRGGTGSIGADYFGVANHDQVQPGQAGRSRIVSSSKGNSKGQRYSYGSGVGDREIISEAYPGLGEE